MVTGKLEGPESSANACLREMQEETGLSTETLFGIDVTWFCDHKSSQIKSSANYCAFVSKDAKVRLSPREHIDYEWVTVEEAAKRLAFPAQVATLRHIHEHFVLKKPHAANLVTQQSSEG